MAVPDGLYVRGEVGAGIHSGATFTDTNPAAPNCDLCSAQFPSSIGTSAILGGAIGWRFTPNFRADLSVDYLTPTTVSGHSTAAVPSSASANLNSLVTLINGYFDFPELHFFGLLSPFATVGIGFATNDLGVTSGTSGAVGPFSLTGVSRTNFAWDAGLGAAYPLTPKLTADIGWRFLDTGQMRSGSILSVAGTTMQVTPSKTGDVNLNVFTIGLRYQF